MAFPPRTYRFQQNKLEAALLPFRRVNRGSASASLAVTCGGAPSPDSAPACALTLALPCFLAAAGTSDAVKRCSSKIGNRRVLHGLAYWEPILEQNSILHPYNVDRPCRLCAQRSDNNGQTEFDRGQSP